MRSVVLVEPTVRPLGFTIAATCTRLGFVSHQKQGCTSEHALHEDPNILRAQDEAFSSLPLHNDLGSGKGRRPTPGSPLFGIGHVHTSRCRASAKSGSAAFTSMAEPFSEGNRAIPVGSHGCPLYPRFQASYTMGMCDATVANRQSDAYLLHTSVSVASALSKAGLDERIQSRLHGDGGRSWRRTGVLAMMAGPVLWMICSRLTCFGFARVVVRGRDLRGDGGGMSSRGTETSRAGLRTHTRDVIMSDEHPGLLLSTEYGIMHR